MAGQRAGGMEAQEFAAAFRGFLDWFHLNAGSGAGNEAVELTRTFLGQVGAARSVVKREFAAFEHINVQTALNAWLAQAGREGEIHGVTLPPHYGSVSLSPRRAYPIRRGATRGSAGASGAARALIG
ncbi:MAG: hypothetical protein M3140_05025 [Actinomycetota bacterium]|nr:hypothetical protein [Actinomycetota bacterium]